MPSMFSLWNPLPWTSYPLSFSNKSQQAFCQSRWHNAINGVEVKPNNVLLLRSLPKLFLSITGVFWHTWQFLILCSDTPDNSWFFEKLQTHRPFIHLQQFHNSYFYYLKYSFKSAFNNVFSIGNSIKFSSSNNVSKPTWIPVEQARKKKVFQVFKLGHFYNKGSEWVQTMQLRPLRPRERK